MITEKVNTENWNINLLNMMPMSLGIPENRIFDVYHVIGICHKEDWREDLIPLRMKYSKRLYSDYKKYVFPLIKGLEYGKEFIDKVDKIIRALGDSINEILVPYSHNPLILIGEHYVGFVAPKIVGDKFYE